MKEGKEGIKRDSIERKVEREKREKNETQWGVR